MRLIDTRWQGCFCVMAATLALLITAARAAEPASATYTQDIAITFASPAEAASASLTPTPVYDGKAWALSARWDDNHPGSLKMQEAMAKHGLKGTFYLNHADAGDRYGQAFVDQLIQGGFTIGGHSQSHPFLPTLGPNALFVEVLANRVEREAQADIPVVSFAFPFGVWNSDADAQALARITETLRRSGLHHNTYSRFARGNPHAEAAEFSTCNQIVPGDHAINREKFEANLVKFFTFPAAYQKFSHNISLSTHARQSGSAWDDLDLLLADLVTRADWWICNQNEWATYYAQVHQTRIEKRGVDGSTARFHITRPLPTVLGAVVPLTVEVGGGAVTQVTGDPAKHAWRVADDGRTLVNLAHDPGRSLPTRIDAIQNADNGPPAAGEDASAEFPGLRMWLTREAAGEAGDVGGAADVLDLHIVNASGADLRDAAVTLRLPLGYERGVQRLALDDLGDGQERHERYDLGPLSDDPAYREGPLYYVAQIDFRAGSERGRVFATVTVAQPTPARPSVRDAAAMLGPIDAGALDPAWLQTQAQRGAALTDIAEGAASRWFRATAEDRSRFIGQRLTLFRDDAEWLAATKPFNRKDHAFLASMDIRLDRAAPVAIVSEMPVSQVFLNGQAAPADQPLPAAAGVNHLVVVFGITDKRIYWKSRPVWFALNAGDAEIEYLVAE